MPDLRVEVVSQIDSTNSELMRRFRAASSQDHTTALATLLVAEQQTAGRGTRDRTWHSQAGSSLTFSLGMAYKPANWSGLSLAIGLTLAESLDPVQTTQSNTAALRLGLKWPNDLWLHGCKVGGVLVETLNRGQQPYVVVGVGLNVQNLTLAGIPTASLAELENPMDAKRALHATVAPLVQTLQAFAWFGFAPFQARFAARDALMGRTVMLPDGTQGTAHGVSESGALLVQTAAGMQTVTDAQVSVLPLQKMP